MAEKGAMKSGRKVQFIDDVDDNLQDDPANTRFGKDDFSKGGKGSKSSKPGNTSTPKYELNPHSELPTNSQCVMDCEAADILQGIQEQMVLLSRDPTIKLPVSFDRGLEYAKAGARYTNPETVRQVLENLKNYGVSDGEICVIANTCPETTDEVFALVPSLKAKRSKVGEPLKDILSELAKLRLSSEGQKEYK